MRPYISFSEWKLFRNECQWRWKLDYLEKHRRANYGVYLDFGTSIHEAIEHYKTRKNPVTVDEAVLLFRSKWKELWTANSPKYAEKDLKIKFEDLDAAGERILRRMHELTEFWDAEVVYNEYPLHIPIERDDGLEINFKGFIDMVIKTKDKRGNPVLYVVDFKTCSWGWTAEKRQDRELQYQLFLYKHYLCKKFNLDPKNVRCAFVLLKRTPRKDDLPLEFFPVSAGPVSVQRALDELNKDITRIAYAVKNNKYEKNRKSCVNQYGQVCPYKGSELCPDE